jgi:hypothetical protein
MRNAWIKATGAGYCHAMSRIIERRHILGGRAFLEETFQHYRAQFGPRRKSGARPMRFAEWGGLCTLRDLRLVPVSPCAAS